MYFNYFYGEFDGNGCKFNNATHYLFNTIGCGNYDTNDVRGKPTIIKDFSVNFTGSKNSLIYTLYSKNCTLENVKISGDMTFGMNAGSFINYGTANSANHSGFDYTVNFINCSSSVRIISNQSNAAVLIGHTFEGAGHTATINLDTATYEGIKNSGARMHLRNPGSYPSTADSTSNNNSELFYCLKSNNVVINLGDTSNYTIDSTNDILPNNNVTYYSEINPTKNIDDNSYQITKDENASYVTMQIRCDITAYDESGTKIPNLNGIVKLLVMGTEVSPINTRFEFGENLSVKIFDLISSITMDNTASSYAYCTFENGELKIYTADGSNYQTGTISIVCTQYNSEGEFITTGGLTIGHKDNYSDTYWSIN